MAFWLRKSSNASTNEIEVFAFWEGIEFFLSDWNLPDTSPSSYLLVNTNYCHPWKYRRIPWVLWALAPSLPMKISIGDILVYIISSSISIPLKRATIQGLKDWKTAKEVPRNLVNSNTNFLGFWRRNEMKSRNDETVKCTKWFQKSSSRVSNKS